MGTAEIELDAGRLRLFHLWFFRDLSSEQRQTLFRLAGLPVEQIRTHIDQRRAIDYVLTALHARQDEASSLLTDRELWDAGCLTRWQLENWPDSSLAAHPAGVRNTIRYLLKRLDDAALPARQDEAGVRVKPLEWRHVPDVFPPMWVADTPIGGYHIEEVAGSDSPTYDVIGPPLTLSRIANVDGLPEAKAAAQADYERRILSALVTQPPAPTSELGQPQRAFSETFSATEALREQFPSQAQEDGI